MIYNKIIYKLKHIYVNIYERYIWKYIENILSLYNGTSLYVFKADNSLLEKQLLWSSPRKAVSPILRIP